MNGKDDPPPPPARVKGGYRTLFAPIHSPAKLTCAKHSEHARTRADGSITQAVIRRSTYNAPNIGSREEGKRVRTHVELNSPLRVVVQDL